MKLLFVGDVVGNPGRTILKKALPAVFRKHDVEYCKGCHEDKVTSLQSSPHTIIPCEDCHGPAMDHPDNPPKLTIDKSREMCLRCHAFLPYPTSGRAVINGIDPEKHNPGVECVSCHNPHNPMEGLK